MPAIDIPEGMALIPAGTFQMGSDDPEADADEQPAHLDAFYMDTHEVTNAQYKAFVMDAHEVTNAQVQFNKMFIDAYPEWGADEQPVHTVHLDAFYMDTHEVTNAQFKAFVDANPQWQKDNIDARFHNGWYLHHWTGTDYPAGKGEHPVVWVTWYAAMAYAEWAGKRLPTEAEWEYAARGGLAGQKYPWGDTLTPADANYNRNVGDTTPVGAYAPNGYGLYDMAGNVYEWCLDALDEDFYAASHDSRNPIAGGETVQELRDNFTTIPTYPYRVLRGGSWNAGAQFLRVANRSGSSPTTVSIDGIGFRCAAAVTP